MAVLGKQNVSNLRVSCKNIVFKRAIIIFPQFGSHTNLIQDIRNRYDPLANKIAPHITLVFPFDSQISSKVLYRHIKNSLQGFEAFSLSMQGISHEAKNYLFLNLMKGREDIIKIHDLLYSELIARFLSKKYIYRPHLTVGHLPDTDTAKIAIRELKHFDYKFETKIDKITTEIILENLSSEVDFEIKLK